mgnify:CR=1 FL=1
MADVVKLIYALWGTGLDTALKAPELHEQLRAAGATRLQVNVDDADTRAAVTAERAVLEALEAGCAAPVGALAEIVESHFRYEEHELGHAMNAAHR